MGPLTPIIGLHLLALAAGLRHNAEIGQPGLCLSAYGHKFGINHLIAAEFIAPMSSRPAPSIFGRASVLSCAGLTTSALRAERASERASVALLLSPTGASVIRPATPAAVHSESEPGVAEDSRRSRRA